MRRIAMILTVALCLGVGLAASCRNASSDAGAGAKSDAARQTRQGRDADSVSGGTDSVGQPSPERITAAEDSEPEPETIVRKMADYLGGLPAFACRVDMTIQVQAEGMDTRLNSKMAVRVQRPNRLAVFEQEGNLGATVVSDGVQLIQYIAALNRYSITEAPADLADIGGASGIDMIGLPAWANPTSGDDFYNEIVAGVTSSRYVGTEKIGEILCHRCRFMQSDLDWDIWIGAGDQPLVYKLVPDFSKQVDDAAGAMGSLREMKVEYVVTFDDWNVAPKFTDADFAFTPPADAEKVDSLMEGMGGGFEEAPHPLLGQQAPTFQTVDLDGKPVDLSTYLEKNVVMLDFWATWCGPCIEAMPEVLAVANKFKDRGVVFYAVNVGEDGPTVSEFLESQRLEVPVAFDTDGRISDLYQATGIPQTVLIGKDGKVQVVHVGFSGNLGNELSTQIEALLEGKDLAAETSAAADRTHPVPEAVEKHPQAIGVTRAWSAPGRWSGVAVDTAGGMVYAAGTGQTILCLDANGQPLREIDVPNGGILRLANLVGDATPELLVFTGWGNGVRAHLATGELLWEYPGGMGVDDVWPADINGDGLDEVIVGYNGLTGLHVLDQRGTPLWKFSGIGNVWHVSAGDFNGDGNVEIVTTSAVGDVHVFDATGGKLRDIDVSIYANMVRMTAPGDGPRDAIVAGSTSPGVSMTRINFAGEAEWAIPLPKLDVDFVDDMAIAPDVPWAAAAMRGGLVHVVDLDTGQIIARAAEQGMTPQVGWLPREGKSPLLVVATGRELNSFEVTPTDMTAAEATAAAESTQPAETPDDGE